MASASLMDHGQTLSSKNNKLNTSILQRIAQGDSTAVEDCLSQYSALVWSLAKRFCGSASDAEDATQDIFVEIWQKAERFDPMKSSEPTFISMIARRRLIDRYRRTATAPKTVALDSPEVAIPEYSTTSAAEHAEDADKATKCLQKLTNQQQHIITLSIHHGHSHSTISTLLAIPLGTVKSYARRGLIQLRDCMQRPAAMQTGGGAS